MTRPCEVCSGMLLAGQPIGRSRRMRRVLLERRLVALCDTHANAVIEGGLETLDALRSRFVEPEGRRSTVDRRSPLDRRLFPPRPEGRRRTYGRRATDPET